MRFIEIEISATNTDTIFSEIEIAHFSNLALVWFGLLVFSEIANIAASSHLLAKLSPLVAVFNDHLAHLVVHARRGTSFTPVSNVIKLFTTVIYECS